MFDLGFTMEELMFPENFQFDSFENIEKNFSVLQFDQFDEMFVVETKNCSKMKQIGRDVESNVIDDQILPLLNSSSMIVVDKRNENCLGSHLYVDSTFFF